MFDPYLQWLNIPKSQRPITCYRLLGLNPKIADPDTVDEAAEEIAEVVRAHETGEHAEAAARILKEIEQARIILRTPAKRKEYDARLSRGTTARPPADLKVAQRVAEAEDDADGDEVRPSRGRNGKKRPVKQASRSPMLLFVILGLGLLMLLTVVGGVGAYFVFFSTGESAAVALAPETTPQVAPPKPTQADKPKIDPPKPTPPAPTPAPPPAPKPPAPAPKPVVKKEKPKVNKLPEPTSEAQAVAEKALKETYKADYAKPKPEDRQALSAKFLVPGRENRADPAAWFVMLREARDLAIEAKRPRLAFEAIHELDQHFNIDPVAMRLRVINDIAKGGSEVQVATVFRSTQNLIQQTLSNEDFDAARKYQDAIEQHVRDTKGEQLLQRLREQRSEMADYVRDYEAVTKAREKLKASPDDPEANLTVGRYLCLFQGNWDEGLPLLAKGGKGGLAELARKDLANPTELKDQMTVANGWWAIGDPLRDRGQLITFRRARLWYERAGGAATGDDRQQIINRVQEAQRREIIRFQRLLPGSFLGRGPEDRVLLLREGGGNLKSEEAIERGLDWLAAHQFANSGAWTTDGFHRAGKCKCTEFTAPDQKHDIAGTAFGLLPFLGAGETHKRGKYQQVVQKGINYLVSKQKFPDGNFHDNAYENALASIAIIEAYGLTRDRNLAGPAQAAALYIARAQFTDGSWGYSKNTKGDLSVSGWQFTALKAAAYAGLAVPQESFDRLSQFLDTVADPNGLGYGYNAPGAGLATSAVGLLCRQFLSWGPGHPGLTKAVGNLLRSDNYLTKDKNNLYAAFYVSQVAHHLGGEHWEKWNASVRDVLIDFQDKGETPDKSHQKGSWSPRGDAYEKQGGRLMYTALSIIALEAYYYHVPLYGYGPYVLLD